jgi:hypothetical protein
MLHALTPSCRPAKGADRTIFEFTSILKLGSGSNRFDPKRERGNSIGGQTGLARWAGTSTARYGTTLARPGPTALVLVPCSCPARASAWASKSARGTARSTARLMGRPVSGTTRGPRTRHDSRPSMCPLPSDRWSSSAPGLYKPPPPWPVQET